MRSRLRNRECSLCIGDGTTRHRPLAELRGSHAARKLADEPHRQGVASGGGLTRCECSLPVATRRRRFDRKGALLRSMRDSIPRTWHLAPLHCMESGSGGRQEARGAAADCSRRRRHGSNVVCQELVWRLHGAFATVEPPRLVDEPEPDTGLRTVGLIPHVPRTVGRRGSRSGATYGPERLLGEVSRVARERREEFVVEYRERRSASSPGRLAKSRLFQCVLRHP